MEEKRHCPRFSTAVKVQELTNHKTRWTRNLSLGGCLMEKSEDDFLPMASYLALKLEIPGANESVVAFGTVRHGGNHSDGYGIQFEIVDKMSAYYIEKFMGVFL